MNTPDINQFVKYLKSNCENTRIRAVKAVAASGHKQANRVLKAIANGDISPNVRFEAKRLLDKLDERNASSAFNQMIATIPEGIQGPEGLADLKVPTETATASTFSRSNEPVTPHMPALVQPISPQHSPNGKPVKVTSSEALKEHFTHSSPSEQMKLLQEIEASVTNYKIFLGKMCPDDNNTYGTDFTEEVRATIAKIYGTIGGPDDITSIAKFLKDSNTRVRANAIEGLELIGHPKAFPYITYFLQDKDNRIRANVVKAIQKFGKRNLEGMLDNMLLSSGEKWMRSSAAYCLAIMATEDHLPMLKRGMEDPERSIRGKIRTAIERLARDGSVKAKELLEHFSDQTTIFHVEENSSFGILTDGTLDIEQLFHEEARFRAAEVARIGEKNDPRYLPVLFDCLEQESTDIVAKKILNIICHFKPAHAVNKISGKLNSPNPKIVKLAVSAIMEIDNETGTSLVAGTLNHSDKKVAINTFIELKKASPELALAQVEVLLFSPKPFQRGRGLSFLNLIESNEAPDHLAKNLLAILDSEKELNLIEQIATLYERLATKETLPEYFALKIKYSKERATAKSENSKMKPASEAKIKNLEQIRSKIAQKLQLSPEDLGTMEGAAEKKSS